MGGYRDDRSWADRYINEQRRIIGPFMLDIASATVDRSHATDLVVLNGAKSIACRVRRPGYAERGEYRFEFTVRYKRESGAETEHSKIMAGFADWMFYGHADNNHTSSISRWMIVDLHSFREHIERGGDVGREKYNNDGETSFMVYDVRDFHGNPPILVSASHAEVMDSARPCDYERHDIPECPCTVGPACGSCVWYEELRTGTWMRACAMCNPAGLRLIDTRQERAA